MSGWRGWILRRFVMAPLMPLLALLALLLWVLALVASLLLCPPVAALRRQRPRWRVVRLSSMALCYLVGECVCLLLCLGLWLLAGLGRSRKATWFIDAHRAILRKFLASLVSLAGPLFGFRLEIHEPDRHPEDLLRAKDAAPLLVLARHAGPGASFALVHVLLSVYDREVHVVLKDTLRLDPAIDLLLTNSGCTWIPARRDDNGDAVDRVRHAAAGLHGRQSLLLFPEGADWTPLRHVLAVARLRRRGLLREAQQALRMPHVLPPRPAGTLAALQGASGTDVLIFTHTGHDELLDATSAWRALPLRRPLQMAWWRAPAHLLPSDDEVAVSAWLHDIWSDIDAWIEEQNHLGDLQPG